MVESRLVAMEDLQSGGQVNTLLSSLEQHDWYSDIVYYFKKNSCPANFDKTHKRSLKLRAAKYCLVRGGLGWRNPNGVILRCFNPLESKDLL